MHTKNEDLEQEHSKFFLLSQDIFCTIGVNGYFILANPAFNKLLDYSDEEVFFNPFFYFIHPDDLVQTKTCFEQFIKGSIVENQIINRYKKKNEDYCLLLWTFLRFENNKVYAAAKDITAQKNREDQLIECKNNYKTLFINAPLPQWIFNIESLKFIDVNDAAIKHYGYSRDKFLQMQLSDLRPPESRSILTQILKDLKEKSKLVTYTTTHIKSNGEKIIVEVTASKVVSRKGSAAITTINDITEKLKLQEKLTNEKVFREKKITQATIIAQENEKEYIGKELHDNVTQVLTSAKLLLDMAEVGEEIRIEMIQRSRELILTSINEIRSLSRGLVPPSVKGISFIDSIKELTEPYLITKTFDFHFSCDNKINSLPANIKLALYRIIQEQINNISKYSKAKNVWLLIKFNKNVELTVRDDGQGFDTSKKTGGIGITNIKARVAHLNGKLLIDSMPGQGCTLFVNIPISAKL